MTLAEALNTTLSPDKVKDMENVHIVAQNIN